MAAAYTIRVLAEDLLGVTAHASQPVPAGRRWVIRDVVATNNGSAAATLFLAAAGLYLLVANLEVGTSYHLELRQVLEEGETLTAATDNPPVQVWVTAYELSA